MHSYGFIILSFVLGLIAVAILRSLDRYEKEPFAHLFAVVLWGGLWANFICLLLYRTAFRFGVQDVESTMGALLVVGPVEELSKLLALLVSYLFFRRQINEPLDGILYMSCVALGFSLIENYYYATMFTHGNGWLLLTRLAICTPVHIACSALMGLAFYIRLNNPKATGLVIMAFVYASLVHGIYDMTIFNGWTVAILVIVIWSLIKCMMVFLSYAAAKSPFRRSLGAFLNDYPDPLTETGLVCPVCGSTSPKKTYHLGIIPIQACDGCHGYLVSAEKLKWIYDHFVPAYGQIQPGHKYLPEVVLNKKGKENAKTVCFDAKKLNKLMESQNRAKIASLEAKWWFPEYLFRNPRKQRDVNAAKLAWRGIRRLRRRLIYPFSREERKPLHFPQTDGPLWNWGAFLLPELWFCRHKIWGACLLIWLGCAAGFCLIFTGRLDPLSAAGTGLAIILRLISSHVGPVLYHYRHGQWP